MEDQSVIDYNRIAKAIAYLQIHFKSRPSLNEIAEAVDLSPFHFQRLFTKWAGTSPSKFLQYISIEHAKCLLKEQKRSIFDTAYETGYSSSSRLHDAFVKIESMTPAEFKQDGKNLSIHYSFAKSPFGRLLVASTSKGICYLAFTEENEQAFQTLQDMFPKAQFINQTVPFHQTALQFFGNEMQNPDELKLHLKGSLFQLKVWEALLKIPTGNLSTYGQMSEAIEQPKASRAVGTAIGKNPIAFLIPCHRVIQASGCIGGYRWGSIRKTAIIGWEAARLLKCDSK